MNMRVVKEGRRQQGSKFVTNCLYGNRKRLMLWEEQRHRRSTSSCRVPAQRPNTARLQQRRHSSADRGMAELPFLTFVNKQFVSPQILLRTESQKRRGKGEKRERVCFKSSQ